MAVPKICIITNNFVKFNFVGQFENVPTVLMGTTTNLFWIKINVRILMEGNTCSMLAISILAW